MYNLLFYQLFLELHPHKLFIAYSIVFIKKIRQTILGFRVSQAQKKAQNAFKRIKTKSVYEKHLNSNINRIFDK